MTEPKSPDRPAPAAEARDALDQRIAEALRARPAASAADDPDDELILRVLEDRASPGERARVAASPLAAEKLAILSDSAGPVGVGARYVFAVADGHLELLRGPTDPVSTQGRACELHHPISGIVSRIRIELQTSALAVEVKLLPGALAALRQGGRALDSAPADDAGKILFTCLRPDRYELELGMSGAVIGIVVLEFLSAC